MSKYKVYKTRGAVKAISNPSHTLYSPVRRETRPAEIPQAPRAIRSTRDQKLKKLRAESDILRSEISKMPRSSQKDQVLLRLANERLFEIRSEIAELVSSLKKQPTLQFNLFFNRTSPSSVSTLFCTESESNTKTHKVEDIAVEAVAPSSPTISGICRLFDEEGVRNTKTNKTEDIRSETVTRPTLTI